jgi:hypothetical protein
VANRRSQARNSASCAVIGGGVRRIVERWMPTTVQVSAHLVEFLAGPQEFVALGELADDLIWRMPPPFVRCHVVVDSSSPEHRATESRNDWTTTTGSPHSDQATDDAGRPRYVPALRVHASAAAGAIEEVLLRHISDGRK